MGVLKPKQESESISFKVPVALKRELDDLRSRADAAGYDLAETVTAGLWRFCKQVKTELEGSRRSRPKTNGRSGEAAVEKLQ